MGHTSLWGILPQIRIVIPSLETPHSTKVLWTLWVLGFFWFLMGNGGMGFWVLLGDLEGLSYGSMPP